PEEVAAGVKHIDEATAGTGNVILFRVILKRVSDKNFAIEIPDAEWSIPRRKVWIGEAVEIHLIKIFIERMNLACMEICRIQEIMTIGFAERCTFVNSGVNAAVCSVIHSDYSVRRIHGGVPA